MPVKESARYVNAVGGRYAIENFNPTRKDNLVSEIKKMKDNIRSFQNYISEIFVNSEFQKLVIHDRIEQKL